jgi:2-amino-4-hydroxy-6-hydroxymethyldihydropteridine diphosphokinase
MTTYAIALGSNHGDRAQHLRVAVEEIGRLGDVSAVSGLYETAPIGGPEQGPYLNAVVVVAANLGPHEVLGRLQAIEKARGRERTVHWGPRTLDLDIVATDDGTVDTAELQIPHPRASERRFVLEPLCEVWPEAVVADGLTAAEARDLVNEQEVDLLLPTWVGAGGEQGRWWVAAQLTLLLAITIGIVYDGSLPDDTAAPVRIAGGLALILGGALVLAAARSLGGALTIMPEPAPGSNLVENGVYAHARHPMYGGVSLVMLGVSLLLASVTGAVSSIALFAFFWAKSGYEERRLRIVYPWYAAYRRRVRRRMLPYLL